MLRDQRCFLSARSQQRRCYDERVIVSAAFGAWHIRVRAGLPFGRGMGLSGAAVVIIRDDEACAEARAATVRLTNILSDDLAVWVRSKGVGRQGSSRIARGV